MKNEIQAIEAEERKLNLELKKFEMEEKKSGALAHSAFFPKDLQGDIASAVIIQDLAKRMDISVMEVSQSIYIVYGKPSFATQFYVARLNQSGLIVGSLNTILSDDKQSCYCEAVDSTTGDTRRGLTYTIKMARDEGLVDKKGSKWKTMPDWMLMKRSQSFFIKQYYPQVLFGMQTKEELTDVVDTEIVPRGDSPENANKETKQKKIDMTLDDPINDTAIVDAEVESEKKNVSVEDIWILWSNSDKDKKVKMRPLLASGWKNFDQEKLNILHEDMLKA